MLKNRGYRPNGSCPDGLFYDFPKWPCLDNIIQECRPIKSIIIGVLLVAAGGAVAVFFAWPLVDKALASTEWPQVSAVVIESGVDRKRSPSRSNTRRSRRSTGTKTSSTKYKAHVVYEYTIDGEHYECDTVWYGNGSSSSQSSAKKIAARYPVGMKIEAHYMPSEPSEAVLMPGAYFSSYLPLMISGIFLIIGLLICVKPILRRSTNPA